jgi:hypothetical protein
LVYNKYVIKIKEILKMDIKDERKGKNTIFGDLVPGDVFEFDGGGILMKIDEVGKGACSFNAVYLGDGDLEFFDTEDKVIPLVVQLRIIRND